MITCSKTQFFTVKFVAKTFLHANDKPVIAQQLPAILMQ